MSNQKKSSTKVNKDYYIEDGKYVFTSDYHLRRGYCCGSGCRHCPYAHENVKKVDDRKV